MEVKEMFWSWSTFLGAIAYVIAGYGFHQLAKGYMREMSAKVAEIDERFVNELFFTIHAKSERRKDLISALLFLVWPVVIIAVVIRAEWVLNRIKNHVWAKGS
jgi:hypothetical protein